MATSNEEIGRVLDEHDLKWRSTSSGAIVLTFSTTTYVDPDGDKSMAFVLDTEEEGQVVVVRAPMLFVVGDPHQRAVTELCLRLQWELPMVRFAYDASDGELAFHMLIVVGSSPLDGKALVSLIVALVRVAEYVSPSIHEAAATGTVVLPLATARPENDGAANALENFTPEALAALADFEPQALAELTEFSPDELGELRRALADNRTASSQ